MTTNFVLCEEVKSKHPRVTYADLYQDSNVSPNEGCLPDAKQGPSHLREKMSLRIIVQALFFEQLQLRTSIAGCFLVSNNLADGSRQFRSGLGAASQEGGWNTVGTQR
ncbi:BTB/POZ domain-containing protein At3g44820-like [Helianthus annuus]|uniref:BTB/POZ domain-containing protein At3g44820-like n=1 Tax=Helianthus annuus TaxID=4232 RepID=UPI00165332BC|nr:BTB/POZ domain-containing protein At3g44820-like [Helianthus annuus]